MTVSIAHEGVVAVLTLDFPENHNALSKALVCDALAALGALEPGRTRAIVIASSGRFFSAGANIPDLIQSGWLSGRPSDEDPVALFQALAEHRLPVLAAVTGPALGGGFELCLSCDLVVAAETAWFAAPELGLGVIPNTALGRLPAIVGRRRAFEIVATRRRINAPEALGMGLVNQVVPQDEVLAAAIAMARSIVEQAPPGALAVAKQTLDLHALTDWAEVRASVARLPEPEWQEGLAAFVEKRSANYDQFWNPRG
jgi:enoyl-CoA hydratase/carnithine racemase